VIAISGGNIAILAGLTLGLFRLAGLLGRGAMLTAMAGLLLYGELVTSSASVDRATWMATVYFAGRALDLRGSPLNTLALIAGALVAANPLSVAEPGFLLTCGASVAILVAAGGSAGAPSIARSAVALGAASIAAELALFPISALFFSRVTVAGLALNFIAIPMMALAQLAGMLVVPLWLISGRLALAAGAVAAVGAEALVGSAALVDLMPIVSWRLAAPSLWVVAIYYGSVATFVWLHRRPSNPAPLVPPLRTMRARRIAVASAVCAAAWILFQPGAWWLARGDGSLHVTFIDVGQGDAALIRFPTGEHLLVDAGGAPGGSGFDIGDRVVGQVLRTFGVRRLDALIVTHGDADHIGGARSIVREFRPHEVWEGVPVPPSNALQALRGDAMRHRARWVRGQRRDQFFIGDVEIAVRHPPRPDWERQAVRNDDSMVLELLWRDVSVVLTGDIGAEVEAAIAADFAPAKHRVLKVGHHGSLTSSSERFLDALTPEIAVVSAGRNNSFGHPAPAVVQRFGDRGIPLYRTDRDGAVTMTTDGYTIATTTFNDRADHEKTKRAKPGPR
jgi:competence protein ComEC